MRLTLSVGPIHHVYRYDDDDGRVLQVTSE